jgi:phosphonate transport system substrate-binding protein
LAVGIKGKDIMGRSLVILVLVAGVLAGCAAPQASTVINLSQLDPLPVEGPTEVVPLRVAVAAIISPKDTLDSYTPLLDYIGEKVDRPIELVQRRTYAEINELIKNGEVDLAFVCTSAYVIGAREFGMELLAAPQVEGKTVYYSLLVVPVDSPAQSMADLRGQVFAFTDPLSNTGRLYPTAMVQQLGETPDQFFGRTFFTYSHDDAIRAVANGVADGAAVDSLVYEYSIRLDPELRQKIQIIHRSPAFGIPPVVIGPHLRPQHAAELQSLLLDMADDPTGQAALEAVGFDRFVPISDGAYDSVRELETIVSPER